MGDSQALGPSVQVVFGQLQEVFHGLGRTNRTYADSVVGRQLPVKCTDTYEVAERCRDVAVGEDATLTLCPFPDSLRDLSPRG